MGMFDNISVSGNLPYSEEMIALGLDKNTWIFQTKDLDNVMGSYFIQDGKLFRQLYKTETWIEGDPKAKKWIDRMGRLETKDPYLQAIGYHGEIYFYDSIIDVQDKYDCWVEFKAIFNEGNLVRIELFEFTKEDNTERKQREKNWAEEIERQNNIWYNKYIFHTKPYRWFSRRVWYATCNKLGSFFHSISYKL